MHTGDLVSGKYRLVEQLGEGGMGEVWSAVNQLTNRRFAIKLLLPALAHHREALDRFLLEARATGELDDPCIVRVYDAGVADDGRPYLVMELLAGESLESRLAREERLAPLTACIHFSRIARALDRAHAAGIVHRDLSSANVFFASSGDGSVLLPKVLDFGVSKIQDGHAGGRVRTGRGAVLGSPAYMSPEQARGADQVDARSDVWSLGVLLYESLTGRPPFAARNYNALMVAILSAPHAPLASVLAGVDADLATLVDECLIKDPGARVASALDVASRLERIAERLRRDPRAPLEHPRRRASDRAAPSARRGGRAVTAVGAALGGTAFGLALGVALMSRPTEP
ncbi:MAG: serine/threonine-protein kinase, partial [Sorangiineae bacterium]|nr:serine/threonine-protein kinase [Sorangiineae bacterium]